MEHWKYWNVQGSGFFTNYRGSHPEILEKLFWKIQENSLENICGQVFCLILANKSTPLRKATSETIWESCRDGFCCAVAVARKCEDNFQKIPKSSKEKVRGSILY